MVDMFFMCLYISYVRGEDAGQPLATVNMCLNIIRMVSLYTNYCFSVLFLATKQTGLCSLAVSVSVNIASMGSSRRRRVFVELHTEMSDPKS